jgi:hypothetical protein
MLATEDQQFSLLISKNIIVFLGIDSNTTMHVPQMIITRFTLPKSRQANPADMNSTTKTLHVVTPTRLLHQGLAARTILNVVFQLEHLQCFGVERVLVLGTGYGFMGYGFALRADVGETGSAEEDGVVFRLVRFIGFDAIDRWTVGGRAELVFGWVRADVDFEA